MLVMLLSAKQTKSCDEIGKKLVENIIKMRKMFGSVKSICIIIFEYSSAKQKNQRQFNCIEMEYLQFFKTYIAN